MRLRFQDGWAAEVFRREAGSQPGSRTGEAPEMLKGTLSQTDPGGPGGVPARSGPRAKEADWAPETQPSFPLPVFSFIWEPPEGVPAACRFMRCRGSGRGWRHGRQAAGGRSEDASQPPMCFDPSATPPPRHHGREPALAWAGPRTSTCCLSFPSWTLQGAGESRGTTYENLTRCEEAVPARFPSRQERARTFCTRVRRCL